MKSLEAKIVVLGSQGVGKTSVVVRYVSNMFNKHVSPTIGASFFTCKVFLDNYRVKLQVWDTAGQERFRSMAPMYYRKANAAVMVYDITSLDSFEDIKSWVTELKRNVDNVLVMCVLGNKCDLLERREVDRTDAEEYASSIGAMYFETSAVSNEGIQEAFVHISKELAMLYERHPNCGIHTMDSYIHTNLDPVKVQNSNTDTNFPGNLSGQPSSQVDRDRRGGCCW